MTRPFRHALAALQADWDACAANNNAPCDARPNLRGIIGFGLLVTIALGVGAAALFSIGG